MADAEGGEVSWAAKAWGRFAAANHKTGPVTEGSTPMATITKIAPSAQPNAGTVHWLNQCVERGKTEVFSEVVTVSPGLAAELLRRNDGNRSVRQTKAEQYAIDMREGRWAFNGEPIIISVDGKLNDGQHRLQAVIDANICVVFLLVFGLSRESRETVDQGAARGASDYLGMGGLPNATTAAGIARLVLAYEQAEGQSAESKLITNASVVERVRADSGISTSAHFAVTTGRGGRNYVAGVVIGFCHYLFTQIDADDANEFLTQVCTGQRLNAGSPALAVRERLLAEGKSRQPKIAIIFRGWNFYRRRMKVRNTSLPKTLPFPALV